MLTWTTCWTNSRIVGDVSILEANDVIKYPANDFSYHITEKFIIYYLKNS